MSDISLPAPRAADAATAADWPALPLEPWRPTYETLHLWTQIVGKTRLALAPMENHWWQATMYVTPRGLTTSPMPRGGRTFAVDFDFLEQRLWIRASDGAARSLPLVPRSVADFYAEYTAALRDLALDAPMRPVPCELETVIPFAEDRLHASYDPEAAHRWWQVMVQADRVFKRFRGRFQGKASPSHFFWGSFDLATTRFSGRAAPLHPGGAPNCPDWVMQEAYSRECASAGFWPGGGAMPEAAFYAYAYPAPDGYASWPVRPEGAFHHKDMGEFILPYEAVRSAPSPDECLLEFLQSTHDAAADLGRWDRPALDRPRELWP